MSFLYFGIIPRIVISALESFVISLSEVILECMRYLITIITRLNKRAPAIALEDIRLLFGDIGALGAISLSKIRFSGTYPAWEILYSVFFSNRSV